MGTVLNTLSCHLERRGKWLKNLSKKTQNARASWGNTSLSRHGQVVLRSLQRPFRNPRWRAMYLRGHHILSTNGFSMSILWSHCSIRNFSNSACNSVTLTVDHRIPCRSDYRIKGLGHHITPKQAMLSRTGLPSNHQKKKATHYTK